MTDLNATWNEQLRGPRMSEATGKVIFKYQMPVKEQFSLELPKDAQIIRMQDLDGMFWLWAVVDTDAPTEKRFFQAFKTGAKIPDDFDTSHYVGFCAVFVQMELGLYIFEDRQRYEDELAYNYTVNAATKSDIVKKLSLPTVDLKLSKMDPSDLAGIPKFHVNEENVAKWFKEATSWMYEDPKKAFIADIDAVLSEFGDVFRPLFEAMFRQPRLTQKRIDEIEAQGGFEEEEA